jgi:hypothetical protein
MKKLNLILGFTHQLPFSIQRQDLLDEANIRDFFLPVKLIDLLSSFPNIKSTLYLNPLLISFLDKRFPDFSSKVSALLEKKQIELLCGGYSDPVFSLISKDDKQNQILNGARLINHIFGCNPSGIWLTEGLWDQHLPIDLFKTKIDYTFLHESSFTSSFVDSESLDGYYVCEEDARKVAIFPIGISLNDLISKYSPEDAFNEIIKNSLNKDLSVIFYKIDSIKQKDLDWIKCFLDILNSNQEKLNFVLPVDYFHLNKPKNRIYISNQESIKFKQFLLDNHEANLLHKKMLRVSKKINSAKEGKSRFKVIKEMISQAQDLLLKGQSYHAYSKEFASNVNLSEIRAVSLQNLIKAENLIDISSRQASKWAQVSELDYDCDGSDEIILETEAQNVYVSPNLGGGILELDYRPGNINILSLTNKEDTNQRLSFIEHVAGSLPNLEDFQLGKVNYLTKEFARPLQIEKIKAKEESCKISLYENLKLNEEFNLDIRKQISLKSGDSALVVEYELVNKSQTVRDFCFIVEINLGFQDQEAGAEIDVNNFSIFSKPSNISVSYQFNLIANVFKTPILNSQNKSGGLSLYVAWNVNLEPETPLVLSLKQEILSGLLLQKENPQDSLTIADISSEARLAQGGR